METKLPTLIEKVPDILQLLHKQYIQHLNLHFKGDITAEQFFLLKQISQCEQCNSSELSKLAHVNTSSITIMINRLVEKGYVQRINNKHDRRVVWLEVTKEADPILSEGSLVMSNVITLYLTKVTPEECELFISIGIKMYHALQE